MIEVSHRSREERKKMSKQTLLLKVLRVVQVLLRNGKHRVLDVEWYRLGVRLRDLSSEWVLPLCGGSLGLLSHFLRIEGTLEILFLR